MILQKIRFVLQKLRMKTNTSRFDGKIKAYFGERFPFFTTFQRNFQHYSKLARHLEIRFGEKFVKS